MKFTASNLAVSVAIAVLVALCAQQVASQKTISRQTQYEASSSGNSFNSVAPSGRQPNAVYGGYQAPAPAKRRPVPRPAPRPVQQQQQQQQQYEQSYDSSSSSNSVQQGESDSEPASYGAVAGQPNVDFPAYASIPKTSFTCDNKPYDGFYPDEEAGCQAYHVCWENRRESFLCGVGTLFNAKNQHCDYWYNVECSKSSENWSLNRFFGTSTPENAPNSGPTQPLRNNNNNNNNNRFPDSSAQSPAFAKRPNQQQQAPRQPTYQQQEDDARQAAGSEQWRDSQQVQQQQNEY